MNRHIVKWLSAAVFLLVPGLASAQEKTEVKAEEKAEEKAEQTAADSLPGSPRPGGLSLSPEAPPTGPAPGGRAPSFGAPTDSDAWSFRIGGRISGYAQLGIGHKAEDREEQKGTPLHTPPKTVGKQPFWSGPGGTLTFQYGNQTVQSFVSLEAGINGPEWEGYHRSENGPKIRTAYVAVTPAPIGDLRLSFQVGAFPSNYGAPGPWGWGVFGPVLAVHGYGGAAVANYSLNPDLQLYMEYGLTAAAAVDEAETRGTYTDWPEVGFSTIVNHVHVGLSSKNKYFAKLHLARAQGRDFQTYMKDEATGPAGDGHMDVAALELRWVGDPYGQLGVTPVFWNFKDAKSVHNGIWWGMDWTAGSREMARKFLGGNQPNYNGQIAAVSAEYNFSLSRILSHPKPFDGNGPDLRVSLAAIPYWTINSADPAYDKTNGYFFGAVLQHVMLSWLSAGYMLYGESRDSATTDPLTGNSVKGRWVSYSATAALMLHSDWQAQDRLILGYTRYFYSDFTDSNPEGPLDRDVITLGASVAF